MYTLHKTTEIRLPRMLAKYFRFLSQTDSALKITSAISVPNLMKIGGENAPAIVDERENSVTVEVGRRSRALNNSVLVVKGVLSATFISMPMFQI